MGVKISLPLINYIFFRIFPFILLVVFLTGCLFLTFKIFRLKQKGKILILPIYVCLLIITLYILIQLKVKANYQKIKNLLIGSTFYAKGYTEDRFRKIKIGLKKSDVLKLAGYPIREFKIKNIIVMAYTDIGSYNSVAEKGYHQRWVILNRIKE